MKYTILGKSGLEVSRIAFGTWQLGGDWGPTDTVPATEAIRRAADRGVTLFDTAQGYRFGESERLLATALGQLPREKVVIATKGGLRPLGNGVVRDASPTWIREGVESSLRALATDYIDLYQVHWPDPATPLAETAEALAKLVADGRSATSACRTSTSLRWRPSVPPCRSRPCNPHTTCSDAPSRPKCCPTRRRTTSASWSTGPWPTGCWAGTSVPTPSSHRGTGARGRGHPY